MVASEQKNEKSQRTNTREKQKEISLSSSGKPETGKQERSRKKGRHAADLERGPMSESSSDVRRESEHGGDGEDELLAKGSEGSRRYSNKKLY